MRKILTVVGARPQFIKASALSNALRAEPELTELLVHTGQHYDDNMSAVFFEELGLPAPAYHLGISGGRHGEMTAEMLKQLEQVFLKENADLVLVYGDTNSTLAGALAASKLHIPIAHVEAGLRSFNKQMPEELNRILTDHCSSLLFTPTNVATQNLLHEGFQPSQIPQVGDVMLDVAVLSKVKASEQVSTALLKSLGLTSGDFFLSTIHRQENTDNIIRLKAIFEGLNLLAQSKKVVLPLHPRTKARLKQFELQYLLKGLLVVPPLSYLEMVALESHSSLIITDSGGVRKEAFFHRVPCLTLRDETEWIELVEAQWNRLVKPVDPQMICDEALMMQGTKGAQISPYGKGQASDLIVKGIKELLA